jgi:hypothetical protein
VIPFDYREFFTIAEELGQRNDQAASRTALGRAYYAVLGVALRTLPAAEQARISPGQIHTRVWALYVASTTRPIRQIGGIGLRLRAWRRQADYRDDLTFSSSDVTNALADARRALTLLQQHGYQP